MDPQTTTQHDDITIIDLGVMGYGNADSSISYDKQRQSGELSAEVDEASQAIIRSGEAMVAINNSDDGCIDGRETIEFYDADGAAKPLTDNSNHERAKVAGGGYFTGQVIRLGVGVKGTSIDNDIAMLGADFAAQHVYCGAHTGAHKGGDGTDCGANDKLALILQNTFTYRDQILGSTKALIETAGLTFNPEVFENVLSAWQVVLDDEAYFAGSTGASRLQKVLNAQASATEGDKPTGVTKHLSGDHNEDYIVVNYVDGITFSQGVLAQKLRAAFPENDDKHLAQVFVVDAWRIVELAKAAAGEEQFEQAVYAGVMYQVATAATLTDGSLKMFAVKHI